MRPKKSTRSKATIDARTMGAKATGARTTGARTTGAWTISLVVCVVAAVLIAARQPSPSADSTMLKPQAVAQKTPVAQAQARTTAASRAPATDSEPKALVQESAAPTITGCLERDGETFRLKDATGADMLKSRSWKSGFLKKGSASIDVVDAANSLSLANHIGQRVSVSGTLVDREMQVRSLRRVAASCD